jgi:hypothetical protein
MRLEELEFSAPKATARDFLADLNDSEDKAELATTNAVLEKTATSR